MHPEKSVNKLLNREVLESTDDGFRITEKYRAERDRYSDRLQFNREEVLEAIAETDSQRNQLLEIQKNDSELITTYATLSSLLPGTEHMEVLGLTIVIRQFEEGSPPNSGAPEGFIHVHCESLPAVVHLCRRGIVYAWREDCPPCETTRESIEETVKNQPSDFLLLSVYGPDCPDVLDRELDIKGAPTTLFIKDGEVDSRLVGPQRPIAIKDEIETVRELVDS